MALKYLYISMKRMNNKYEAVIGLEVHAQLATQTKLFCADSAVFTTEPNIHISPITLAHPGTLPMLNKKAVEYAIQMGLACNCIIEKENEFARKNYFYPDLPKGYQISQHTMPICKGGFVTIDTTEGKKQIQLNRIHLEEDAGKSLHDVNPNFTCIDLNRAGVPLIEIVTEPNIYSAEEAYLVVAEIRRLVRWLEICDGNMEEGSLRCDANVSIRRIGEKHLGTKVEIKNLNSLRFIKKAIDAQIQQMVMQLEKGEAIVQQTLSYHAASNTNFPLRDKEEANDYRYFPEPDIAPFFVDEDWLTSIQNNIPVLPLQMEELFQKQYGLSYYDATQLCQEKAIAVYFQQTAAHTTHWKALANWINGPIKQYINEHKLLWKEISLKPLQLAALIQLVETGNISFSTAAAKLLPVLMKNPQAQPAAIAQQLQLMQVTSSQEIQQWIETALQQMPEKVMEYKKGKKGVIGLFVAEVKKISKGKADPKLTMQLLQEALQK
jgi:aspartyl-tRNA(Asn)/glutamyl-tRNA(Gln) amidotransferase subunit B